MKINAKQYARSLYEAVQNKSDSQIKDVLKSFVKVLINNNDISKADKIIAEFSKIWNKKQGVVEAEVISAKELDNPIIRLMSDYIVKLLKAKEVIINKKIDKNLLGGVVIKYGDKILDNSMRIRLCELKNRMIK